MLIYRGLVTVCLGPQRCDDSHLSFQISFTGAMINMYPAYIAFQSSSTWITILTFRNMNQLGEKFVFPNEILNPSFSSFSFISTIHIAKNDSKEIRLRPFSTLILPQIMQTVVTEVTIESNEEKRVTKYERQSDFDKHQLNTKLKIIPGGQETKYGWLEIAMTRDVTNGNSTMTKKWYDKDAIKVRETVRAASTKNLTKTKTITTRLC